LQKIYLLFYCCIIADFFSIHQPSNKKVEVDITKITQETKRINITIPSNILAKIDAFTEKTNESRSGLLLKAALEYIAQHQK
jgi:hypothetical protein